MSQFIWYELITDDVDAAIDFFSHVVGWEVRKSEMAAAMDYRIIHAADAPIGGMMKAPDPRLRPAFFGYVDVADVDAEIKAFEAAGGSTWMPATDIEGVGRLALVSNAEAAPLYVMTPSSSDVSTAFSPMTEDGQRQLGHCGWNEYHSKDWEKAFDAYAGRFGWQKDMAMDMGPMGTYQTFTANGMGTGGFMNDPNLPQPNWLYYFLVGDIDEALGRIEAKGGAIMLPPMQVPGGQWAIVARDPQGAVFGLLGTRAAG